MRSGCECVRNIRAARSTGKGVLGATLVIG